jgi:hypothetical protein
MSNEHHARFLDYIVENPQLIEEYGHLDWVHREGVWRQEHNYWRRMPDLIMQFTRNGITHRTIFELKHCYERRFDAMEQIDSGADYMALCMHYCGKPRGVVGFYSENFESFQFEDVPVRGGLLNVAKNYRR